MKNGTRSSRALTLTLHRGEVLGLIGESGAGKSTIGIAAMGYAKPGCRINGGRIVFDGIDLTEASEEEKRKLRGSKDRLRGAKRGGVVQSGPQTHRPVRRNRG